MKARLNLYGPFVLQVFAATLITIAALTLDILWLKVVELIIAGLTLSVGAYLLGRFSTLRELERQLGWIPRQINFVETAEGQKVAFIEQNSGEVVTIRIPDEIDTPEEAIRFIMGELQEGQG